METKRLTAEKVRALISRGEASAVEICKIYLNNIEKQNSEIKAYIHVNAVEALEQAARIDRMKQQGAALPPLAGLPMAIKDNI